MGNESLEDIKAAKEYQTTLIECYAAAAKLSKLDIPGAIEKIERAHSFGAILNPALYMQNADKMDQDRDVLEAALVLHRHGKKIEEIVRKQREGRP